MNDSEFDYNETWRWEVEKNTQPTERLIGYFVPSINKEDIYTPGTPSSEVWERTNNDGSKVLIFKEHPASADVSWK